MAGRFYLCTPKKKMQNGHLDIFEWKNNLNEEGKPQISPEMNPKWSK